MTLSEYIEREVDAIVDEWAEFARTQVAAARGLPAEALRDGAKQLLLVVAADMESAQSDEEQHRKSRGERPHNAPAVTDKARGHAEDRFDQGFSLHDMVSEYRALRASVTRRWTEQLRGVDRKTLDELVRFGEAIDQALTESIVLYNNKVEESRSLLLGVLGHDLRNPLGAVRTSATYLLRSDTLGGNETKAAARIQASAARMQRMVDDLLDFTRTRMGTALPIAPAAADLGQVCRDTVDELRAFHPDARIALECSGELRGRWDAPRIGQLLSNLLGNAIQHGDPGAPVTLTVQGEGDDAVVLKVHNQGPPIAPEARTAIFEPLMRAVVREAERRAGSSGLGLGLYIARRIALAHGGDIAVASSRQDGTTFTVRLPREPRPGVREIAASR